MVKETYKDAVFVMEIPEGGDLDSFYMRACSEWGGTWLHAKKYPVRFYLRVVGFEDDRVSTENWGPATKIWEMLKKQRLFRQMLDTLL